MNPPMTGPEPSPSWPGTPGHPSPWQEPTQHRPGSGPAGSRRNAFTERLLEVAAYAGGALLLAGVLLIVWNLWGEIGQLGRYILSAAVTVALLAATFVVGVEQGGPTQQPVRRRLSSTLGMLGTFAATGTAVGWRSRRTGRTRG